MRLNNVIKEKKIIIYGIGKLQQDFEYVFPEYSIYGYIDDKEDIYVQLKKYTEELGENLFIIVCHRNKDNIVSILKDSGLQYKKDYCCAEELFYMSEPIFERMGSMKIYVWGTGNIASEFYDTIQAFPELQERIEGFVDNKVVDDEIETFYEYEVCNPRKIIGQDEVYLIIAIENAYEEIKEELQEIGKLEFIDFVQYKDIGTNYKMMHTTYNAFPDANMEVVCRRGLEYITISECGDISFCSGGLVDIKSIGNLNKQEFKEIWNSKKAKIFQLSIKNGTYVFCNRTTCPWLREYSPDKEHDEHRIQTLPDIYVSDTTDRRLGVQAGFDSTCNLYCSSCRSEKRTCEYGVEKKQLINKILEQVMPYADYLFAAGNGEVFISRQYREFLDKTPAVRNLQFLSNGNYVNYSLIEQMKQKAEKVGVSVSLDAASDDTYKKIRRGGNFGKVMNNLKQLSKMRKQGDISYFSLCFVLQYDNRNDIRDFILLAKQLGVDNVYISVIENWGVYSDEQFEKITLFDSENKLKAEYKKCLEIKELEEEMVVYTNKQGNVYHHACFNIKMNV